MRTAAGTPTHLPRRRPVRVVATAIVAVAALALGACASSDDEVVVAETTTTVEAPSTTGSTTTAAPSTTAAPTTAPPSTEPPVETGIVLDASGLTVVPFGASADNTIAALTDALGAPLDDSPMAECPSGADRSVRWTDLQVIFSGGVLVGFAHGARPPSDPITMPLETTEGLAIGDTEADLLAAYPGATVEESSLGTEWYVDGARPGTYLGGLLTGPGGTVTDIWAGDICAFR